MRILTQPEDHGFISSWPLGSYHGSGHSMPAMLDVSYGALPFRHIYGNRYTCEKNHAMSIITHLDAQSMNRWMRKNEGLFSRAFLERRKVRLRMDQIPRRR